MAFFDILTKAPPKSSLHCVSNQSIIVSKSHIYLKSDLLIGSWSDIESIGIVDFPQKVFIVEHFDLVLNVNFVLLFEECESERLSPFFRFFEWYEALVLYVFV